MVCINWIRATILLASFHASQCTGSYRPTKIQILVPHNIHHHTHTKYAFIPVPATRTANKTVDATTPRPTTLLPVMPVVPLLPLNTSGQPNLLPVFPQLAPGSFQPLQPLQPGFQQPNQPGFQQPNQPGFQQPNQPGFQQPQQPTQQPPSPPPSRYIHHHDHHDDYDYTDLSGKSSRNKIIRADPPHSVSTPPIKFKTIINVQETKKIPLPNLMDLAQFLNEQSKKKIQFPKLLDFPKLFKAEPPKRIQVEVVSDKNQQLKQMEKILAQWRELQDSLKSNSYPSITQHAEYDTETAAYKFPPETVAEKPEWVALKQLLEKQIADDFPGLKVDAEIKPVTLKERVVPSEAVSSSSEDHPDLRHIGYIVIGDNNEKHFVGVDGTVRTTKT